MYREADILRILAYFPAVPMSPSPFLQAVCKPHAIAQAWCNHARSRGVIFADRHRADTGQMRIRQSGLLSPGIELRLHLGEIALRFDFGRYVEAGVAQAGH